MYRTFAAMVILAASVGEALAGWRQPDDRKAPLFSDLGKHHCPITTDVKQAQRYFDQGITLAYGFNHAEAIRSFQEAARLDPSCAMAHWGIALAYGPNINMPMAEEAVPKAYAALQKALELAPKVSEREKAYINALSMRYAAKYEKDRGKLDQAYAAAMRKLIERYPDDLDAATLFAEALMDLTPWDYWAKDGKPKAQTQEVLAMLESVLKRDPNHPGANHYYIHAVEASPHPERGLAAAHRLRDLAPGAGHLVHMSSHIYLRLGYYNEASMANERAIVADKTYITQCKVQGFYPILYFSHNIHFLAYSASLEGRSERCLEAARDVAKHLADKHLDGHAVVQWIRTTPLLMLARFGRWDDILGEPKLANATIFEKAMWHYTRGLAFLRKQQTEKATLEAASLEKIAGSDELKAIDVPDFPGTSVVRIAQTILTAELAGSQGQSDELIRGLEEAVRLQDDLMYMEPPFWYFPVRQSLGAALLRSGQAAKAQAVYREDLKRHPRNGWSLYGLLQCLRAQGQTAEAANVQKEFREAWKHADVVLTASCF